MAGLPLFLIFLYFLPPIIAFSRGHVSSIAILVLTVLLGWTALGWLVALIWSLTGNVKREAAAPQQVVISMNQVSAPRELHAAIMDAHRTLHVSQLGALDRELDEADNSAIRKATLARMPPVIVHRTDEDEPDPHLPHGTPLQRHVSREGRPYYRNEIPPPLPGYVQIRGRAFFELRVAGCLHYQADLEAIAGGRRDAPVYFRTNAIVFPEDGNVHDPNAVAVEIDGRLVGHIHREDAVAFRAELATIAGPGAVACRALIENGWPDWYVKLDADRPLEAR